VTSTPIKGSANDCGKTKDCGMREQPIRPLARLPVTLRNAPLNSTNCCLSQFKEDSDQTSVSAQEINHTAYPWAAPRIFRWGVQNRIRERSERKN